MSPLNNSRLAAWLAIVALSSLSGPRALALNSGVAPGQNFDLTDFQLQAWPCDNGSDTVISQPQLATYQDTDSATHCFYTNAPSLPSGVPSYPAYYGAMVFWCPDQGGCETSSNTTHLRTELRDLREYPATDTSMHVETATCRVMQGPKSGSTIIGQIHGDDPITGAEALKLRWMVDGTDSSGKSVAYGTLIAGNKTTVGSNEVYSEFSPVAVAKLGDEIDYTIQWQNRKVTVTVVINKDGGHTYSYTLADTSSEKWDSYPLYFKAGNYNQDDVDGTSDGAIVLFTALNGPAPTQVAAPVFSPGGGTYTAAQNVSISDPTSGATIYFTTNGTTPTTSSAIYSGPIVVASGTVNIEALATKSGATNSSVTSAAYTIDLSPQIASPTANPPGGTYTGSVTVALSDSQAGATLYYTTDGSTPTTASNVYGSPITLTRATVLQFFAAENGFQPSPIVSDTYTVIAPTVATPTFNPGAGSFASAQSVSIGDSTAGATIYYTTNGTTPTPSSAVYNGPIPVNSGTVTIEAIGAESGFVDSSVASATYSIASTGGTLTGTSGDGFHALAISPAATGTFTATFDATPSASPENAVVGLSSGAATSYNNLACIARFNPTGGIDAYNGTAYGTAATSYLANVSYHFRMVVNLSAHTYSVYVTPAGGSEQTVGLNFAFRSTANTMTSLDHWNLDVNSTPAGCSLSVANLSAGGSPPPSQVSPPSFSPGGGTYTSAQSVAIGDSTGGASIRYTTDGSTPSETNGTVYSGPLNIGGTTTLKAIAFESGFTDSAVTGATYTIASVNRTLTGSSGDGFHALAISPAATGTFTATFDATPSVSPENAVVGLSSGAATSYGNLACIARFNPTGQIDAYNGTAYGSSSISYSANVAYHFRLVVNVTAHTYSVYVTPAGGSEQTVGLNYAFRSTANTATSLDHWNLDVNSTPAGCSLTANNLNP
ncbi:MAG: chitobiase/beta-hexosaminidase C-terminal domain-containing protein [Opitutaceae bacterium]|jgi:hypothetical protein